MRRYRSHRYPLAILAGIASLAAVACGGDDEAETAPAPAAAATATPAIAITPPEKTASPERETGVTGQTGGVTQFTLKIQEIIEAYPGTLEEQLKTLESDDTLQSTLEGDA